MENLIKKDGYKFGFDPSACEQCEGKCCIGESGYIWCSIKEMEGIAKFLGLEFSEFTSKYVRKVGYNYSLVERQNGDSFECIFFDANLKRCSIYEVRPKQCRTFPFWKCFKDDISEVKKECPGVVEL